MTKCCIFFLGYCSWCFQVFIYFNFSSFWRTYNHFGFVKYWWSVLSALVFLEGNVYYVFKSHFSEYRNLFYIVFKMFLFFSLKYDPLSPFLPFLLSFCVSSFFLFFFLVFFLCFSLFSFFLLFFLSFYFLFFLSIHSSLSLSLSLNLLSFLFMFYYFTRIIYRRILDPQINGYHIHFKLFLT